ncbi:MAG: rhomboid family intramembrane serine protease [Desulfuromonadales bacterium]|nr:rhomboid family intramembrane serine protease [Desulfuromonadales bacterium]MBN2791881.1 rhomboid family intramembrane serine protease [Desulfuromonadales bacterium]
MTPEKNIELEQLDWVPVPPELKMGISRRPLSKRKLKHWTLVLQAKNIPWRSEIHHNHLQLLVPAEQFKQACQELISYEQENRNWPPPPPPAQKFHENTASTIWVLILLALFHNVTVYHLHFFGSGSIDWIHRGNAYGAKILSGEWWRLLTALTLHSGPLHLVGNIVVGGIFAVRLCWILGSGLAWTLILLSGALGNLLNSLVQSPAHQSIGASTAVFGAVGLLATLNMLHYRQSLWRRWPLPVAAGLGLLGLLGTGGENTDIGAHLFGFLCGVGLGLLDCYLPFTGRWKTSSVNTWLALFSSVLMLCSWGLALS